MRRLGRTEKSDAIRRFLLSLVQGGRRSIVNETASLFGISQQAVYRHINHLVRHDFLVIEGRARQRVYRLGPKRWFAATYDLSSIDENTVHERDFSFVFESLPVNISEICHYGFTEMVNNAIDHSEGTNVAIEAVRDEKNVLIVIRDDGEGIFCRIARLLNLNDTRESLLELSKGKLTTDPKHHTGEGIFFTSRVFDHFVIRSGDLDFSHVYRDELDWLLHSDDETAGTIVAMRIAVDSARELEAVFSEFSDDPDEYRFERTVVPVRLALYEGEHLVSRSQAKRLLSRIERFRYVILDFEGVDSIGQSFADEAFRVFKNRHPEIEITAINMSERVNKMINRALQEQRKS